MTDYIIGGLAPGQRNADVRVLDLEPILVDEPTGAKLLSCSARTLFTLEKDGKIPSVRIGARKLFSVAALREFVRNAESSTVVSEVADA